MDMEELSGIYRGKSQASTLIWTWVRQSLYFRGHNACRVSLAEFATSTETAICLWGEWMLLEILSQKGTESGGRLHGVLWPLGKPCLAPSVSRGHELMPPGVSQAV